MSCWRHALIWWDVWVGGFQDTRTEPASTTKCIRTFWRDDLWAKVAGLFFPRNMTANPTSTSWLKITRQETKIRLCQCNRIFSWVFCSRSDYQSFSTEFLLIYEGTMELKAAKMPCQYGSPWCLMFQKGELSIWTHILEVSWHQQWVTIESRTEAKLGCQETFLLNSLCFQPH